MLLFCEIDYEKCEIEYFLYGKQMEEGKCNKRRIKKNKLRQKQRKDFCTKTKSHSARLDKVNFKVRNEFEVSNKNTCTDGFSNQDMNSVQSKSKVIKKQKRRKTFTTSKLKQMQFCSTNLMTDSSCRSTTSHSQRSDDEQTEDSNAVGKGKLNLKEKLQSRLECGRFRWINEKLYTLNSSSAYKMFKSEPELFDIYHQGFSSQVKKWPVNPVDTIIKWVLERSPELVIVDMGCGEAKLSQNVPNKVFSFDLVAVNDLVTACDMAKVPLCDGSVDVVIFCLSLMGTNLNDFLKEAHRILKPCGIIKIAEVVSRFESLESFVKTVSSFGFKLLQKAETNKMFLQFEFKKCLKDSSKTITLPHSTLKPCLYKKR